MTGDTGVEEDTQRHTDAVRLADAVVAGRTAREAYYAHTGPFGLGLLWKAWQDADTDALAQIAAYRERWCR